MVELLDENVEFRGKQQMDYQQALLIHLSRISQVSAFLPQQLGNFENVSPDVFLSALRETATESLLTSVEVMEAMLTPYVDDEYQKERKKVSERADAHAKEGKSDKFVMKRCALGLLKANMCLMARKNLLLEERETARI